MMELCLLSIIDLLVLNELLCIRFHATQHDFVLYSLKKRLGIEYFSTGQDSTVAIITRCVERENMCTVQRIGSCW